MKGVSYKFPKADIVIFIGTDEAKTAFNNVFAEYLYETRWLKYKKDLNKYIRHIYNSEVNTFKAWCQYKLFYIDGMRVLIVHSYIHFKTQAKKLYIFDFLKLLLQQARPKYMFNVSTIGGTRCNEHVGDVVVTNASKFYLDGNLKDSYLQGKLYKAPWRHSLNDIFISSSRLERPIVNKKLINKIRASLSKKNRNKPMYLQVYPYQHPYVYNYINEPLLTTNGFYVAKNFKQFNDYVGIGTESAVVLKMCKQFKVQALSIAAITDVPIFKYISENEQQQADGVLFDSTHSVCAKNAMVIARAIIYSLAS